MKRTHLPGALLLAAASLLAAGAYAQTPTPAPTAKTNAADKVDAKGKEKTADKDKAADKKDDPATAKGKSVEERAQRLAKEHDAQREKLRSMLKAPMDEAFKQELKRHAERVARIERIKSVAQTEKDEGTVDKATKLLAKENERHDKWMAKQVATTAGTPADPKTPGMPADTKLPGTPADTKTPGTPADQKDGVK